MSNQPKWSKKIPNSQLPAFISIYDPPRQVFIHVRTLTTEYIYQVDTQDDDCITVSLFKVKKIQKHINSQQPMRFTNVRAE